MLPPVKYSFPPLFTFMKNRPIPMMMRKYVKITTRSKRLTAFMVSLRYVMRFVDMPGGRVSPPGEHGEPRCMNHERESIQRSLQRCAWESADAAVEAAKDPSACVTWRTGTHCGWSTR